MTFSQRLRFERELRGWSQAKIASELGTTANTISSWERGLTLPSSYFRQRLCTILDKNAQDLGLVAEDAVEQEVEENTQHVGSPVPTFGSSNRQRLLAKVYTFWIAGVLEQSLGQTTGLELRLQHLPEAVEHPLLQEQGSKISRLLESGKPIEQIYDDFGGELLLLGEAGAGKTTLLLQLASVLIERARQYEEHPLPVLFHLASWVRERMPLQSWLVEELHRKYQVPLKLSRLWVENDMILPLLDGLDEVTENALPSCIIAINSHRREHGLHPIVVCSRSTAYFAQSKRLLLNSALLVQPLTSAQIQSYLEKQDRITAELRHILLHDPTFQELLSTPLMLNIIAVSYAEGSQITERIHHKNISLEDVRRRLFASYSDYMLERRHMRLHYEKSDALRWLSWLASQLQMRNQTVFYIEELQDDWLPDARMRHLYKDIVVRTLAGIIAALLFVLLNISFLGVVKGILLGIVVGAVIQVKDRPSSEDNPQQRKIQHWRWRDLLFACITGILFAFINGQNPPLGQPLYGWLIAIVEVLFLQDPLGGSSQWNRPRFYRRQPHFCPFFLDKHLLVALSASFSLATIPSIH